MFVCGIPSPLNDHQVVCCMNWISVITTPSLRKSFSNVMKEIENVWAKHASNFKSTNYFIVTAILIIIIHQKQVSKIFF